MNALAALIPLWGTAAAAWIVTQRNEQRQRIRNGRPAVWERREREAMES